MSREYDEYLNGHIAAVKKAAVWMLENLSVFADMSDQMRAAFIRRVWTHDGSKFGSAEYGPYDAYFYGEPDEDAFNAAWLHHIHNNPHHWQHWLLMYDDGKYRDPGKIVALEMPKVFALEMVADWWSFSWRSGDLAGMFSWYEEHRDCIVLHQKTREFVESVLAEIRGLIGEGE